MEENERLPEEIPENNEGGEAVGYKPSLSSRIENFFYHYKWHTLVAFVAVIVLVVIGVQMCSKDDYDAYILYAGDHSVSRKENNDIAEYVKITSAIERVSSDFDKNGKTTATLLDLFAPTPVSGKEESSGFSLDNVNTLEYELISGSDYYVCFLSEYNYNKYKIWDDVEVFAPLAPYAGGNTSLVYYDECAVYLSSTEFYKLDGISSLPPDTLVCLRRLSTVASFFNKRHNEKMYERAEVIIENILTYGQ